MPEIVLLKLDAQARKIGARLVIRGLINNSFKDTISYIKKINEQGIIVDIDPKIFNEFNVTHVPVFILKGEGGVDNKSVYDKLAGNVSLSYVLKTFAMDGDLKELANSYLDKLSGDGGK
jgi:conjugal transfer pilus assembly protein TrbC